MKLGPSVAWVIVMLGAVGCGPEVVPPTAEGSGSSSTGPGAVVSTSDAGGSSSGVLDGPATTTAPVDETTSSSTTAADAEGSTTEFECGCPPDVPIDFDTELPAGFTPAEALAVFQDRELSMFWIAYEGMPETVLHVDAAYVGGSVAQGPGGEDGCNFLSAPCSDGVIMEVELTVLTDDGALAWTVPATLRGNPEGFITVGTDPQDIAGNAGTLASWQAFDRGRPFVPVELVVSASRFQNDSGAAVEGWSAEGDIVVLGDAP
jgi:hypothetical protein